MGMILIQSVQRDVLRRPKAFLKITEVHVENDKEQFTISDLVGKMQEYLEETEETPYSAVYMKEKLQENTLAWK